MRMHILSGSILFPPPPSKAPTPKAPLRAPSSSYPHTYSSSSRSSSSLFQWPAGTAVAPLLMPLCKPLHWCPRGKLLSISLQSQRSWSQFFVSTSTLKTAAHLFSHSLAAPLTSTSLCLAFRWYVINKSHMLRLQMQRQNTVGHSTFGSCRICNRLKFDSVLTQASAWCMALLPLDFLFYFWVNSGHVVRRSKHFFWCVSPGAVCVYHSSELWRWSNTSHRCWRGSCDCHLYDK
jgi:hypothetical protein